MRYTKCIRCTKCTKNIRRYKTDRRYLRQYSFHNRAKSRELAGDLTFWYESKNIIEPALAV